MKKVYEKPRVLYESYEMSHSVAACGWGVKNAASLESCGAVYNPENDEWGFNYPPGIVIFQNSSVCGVGNAEDYCYQPSSDGWGVFNS